MTDALPQSFFLLGKKKIHPPPPNNTGDWGAKEGYFTRGTASWKRETMYQQCLKKWYDGIIDDELRGLPLKTRVCMSLTQTLRIPKMVIYSNRLRQTFSLQVPRVSITL